MVDVTFFLMTCGEETEKDCIRAIKPFRDAIFLKEVRNVYPQQKALNEMLSQAQTPYLVPLDSDMILDVNAYDRIRMAIDKFSHDPKWHSILFPLWDTLTERKILALKVLRTDIVKKFPFEDGPTPDIKHFKALTDAGYTCIQRYLDKSIIGKHVVKGRHFCYYKYRDVYMTLRSHGWEWDSGVFMGGRTILEKSKKHFDYFLYRYLMDSNDDYMHCIAGMVDGLTAKLEASSKSLAVKKYTISSDIAVDAYMNWYRSQVEQFAF